MYYVANKEIIHELLDDEIIIANLDSGIYCSIRATGVPIWQLLMAGNDEDFIAATMVQRYALNAAEAMSVIQVHLAELVAANIVLGADIINKNTLEESTVRWPENYQAPLFEQFDDMQNLLMLDPIHEVDEQGWPSKHE